MQLAASFAPGFAILGLASIALSVWAIIDVVSRPEWAFRAAGSSKTLWLVLEIIGFFVCGLVFSLVYLLAIRPKVAAAASFSGPGSGAPPWTPPPSGWNPPPPPPPDWSSPQPGPPPGWYPDPAGSGRSRYWDGNRWSEQVR
jgi:hypothetical protein